jgi:hypothetical protein
VVPECFVFAREYPSTQFDAEEPNGTKCGRGSSHVTIPLEAICAYLSKEVSKKAWERKTSAGDSTE